MTDDEQALDEQRKRDIAERPDRNGSLGTLPLKGSAWWKAKAEEEARVMAFGDRLVNLSQRIDQERRAEARRAEARRLLRVLRTQGATVTLDGDQVRVRGLTAALDADTIARLKAAKNSIIEVLGNEVKAS